MWRSHFSKNSISLYLTMSRVFFNYWQGKLGSEWFMGFFFLPLNYVSTCFPAAFVFWLSRCMRCIYEYNMCKPHSLFAHIFRLLIRRASKKRVKCVMCLCAGFSFHFGIIFYYLCSYVLLREFDFDLSILFAFSYFIVIILLPDRSAAPCSASFTDVQA